jgi:hypothetical protein
MFIFIAPFAFLSDAPTPEQEEAEIYCEMVEIYEQTGGQYGWPPYKGKC